MASSTECQELLSFAKLFHDSSLTSVELLPGDVENWFRSNMLDVANLHLKEDGNLGIPQKVAVRHYLTALKIFNMLRSNGCRLDDPATSEIMEACTIALLLTNPSHQSALNARKRLISCDFIDCQEELVLFSALSCSSRGFSKEPTIWSHRRWVLARIHRPVVEDALPVPERTDLPTEVIHREVCLVFRCCEFYPRNYHAWTHWQILLTEAIRFKHKEHESFLCDQLDLIRSWITSHVSDHSAIHHLCCLLHTMYTFQFSESGEYLGRLLSAEFGASFEHALQLVARFPEHEALWLYLRGILIMECPDRIGKWRRIEEMTDIDSTYGRKCVAWYHEILIGST